MDYASSCPSKLKSAKRPFPKMRLPCFQPYLTPDPSPTKRGESSFPSPFGRGGRGRGSYFGLKYAVCRCGFTAFTMASTVKFPETCINVSE